MIGNGGRSGWAGAGGGPEPIVPRRPPVNVRPSTRGTVPPRAAAPRAAAAAAPARAPGATALTRIGAAWSFSISVWTRVETPLSGQRLNATTALTTASMSSDAPSRTPVVPRLAM